MGIGLPLGVGANGKPPFSDQANAVVSGTITAIGPTQPFELFGPFNLVFYGQINTALTTTAGSLNVSVASGAGLAAGVAVNSANAPPGSTLATLVGTAGTLAIPPITLEGQVNTSDAAVRGLVSTAGLLGATVTGDGIPSGTTVLSIPVPAVQNPSFPGGASTPGEIILSHQPTIATPNPNPLNPNGTPLTFLRNGNAITVSGADAAAIFTGAGITYSGTINIERSFDGGKTFVLCNIGGSGTIAQYTAGTPVSLSFGDPERNVAYRLNATTFASGICAYRFSTTGGAAVSLAVASSI